MKRINLKKFRISLDLKSKEMAELLGLNASYYSNIENGRVDPSYETAEKFGIIFKGQYNDFWELFKKEETINK